MLANNYSTDGRAKFSIILAISILAAFPSAYSLSTYGLFEDLEIYFYFFNQINDYGFISATSYITNATNKYEPVIHAIFYVQSLTGIESIFAFLLFNFAILNVAYSKIIIDLSKSNNSLNTYLAILMALLSYSYFSREIYILRSMYAFIFILLICNVNNIAARIVFLILGILTHTSFILFAAIYILIEYSIKRFSKLNFKIIFCIALSISYIIINNSSDIYLVTSTGNSDAFNSKHSTHNLQSILVVLFTSISLSLYLISKSFGQCKVLATFCLFLTLSALMNYDSYQLMNRIAAPALCITPFLVMLSGNFPFRRIVALIYIASILATGRLLYLFYTKTFSPIF